jgi:hypothetical protein
VVADRCAGASVARFIRCWLPADLSSDTNFFPHRRTLQAVADWQTLLVRRRLSSRSIVCRRPRRPRKSRTASR